jgi:ElaB/YqjD/DUF883 family membrane-anchored ribosome-binding protein
MGDNPVDGGAGPALAAHSKDASAAGPSPASSATGGDGGTSGGMAAGISEKVSRLSQSANEAAGRAASWASASAGNARQTLSGQGGRAADQAAAFVREQPLVAIAATGLVCLALGVLLGRR